MSCFLCNSVLNLVDRLNAETETYSIMTLSNHDHLTKINKRAHDIFNKYSDGSRSQNNTLHNLTKQNEEAKKLLQEKENELQMLYDKRQNYITEVDNLDVALQMLSIDDTNVESEHEIKNELLQQIYELTEVINQKNAIIAQLQVENDRMYSEKGKLLEDIAQAIQDDEQSCSLDSA